MPNLGAPELIIILVVVLILFGPGKLTDVGRSLGGAVRELRRSLRDTESTPEKPGAQQERY
jgi:sec-independent protein translocase protein TatA